ncbi:MAG: hypothetical protein D6805_02740 [Planctomycetota bacterium]|nr:MAG: hypothetical protein D6805_02740 [Planctomycetota bacterium]
MKLSFSTKKFFKMRFLGTIAIVIFSVEFLIMFLLDYLPPLTPFQEMLLDSTSLVLLSTPLLYKFLYAPLISQLQLQLQKLEKTSTEVSYQSREILATVKSQKISVEQTYKALRDFTVNLEELTQSSKQIAQLAKEILELSKLSYNLSQNTSQTLQHSKEAMENIEQSTSTLTARILKLQERSDEITNTLEIIREISNKTDILSLNAALEATKAGESGKSFALVAKEMRRLSEKVKQSANQIKKIIQDTQSAIHASVVAAEDGKKTTQTSIQTIKSTIGEFQNIFELSESINQATNQISVATEQQNLATEQTLSQLQDTFDSMKKIQEGIQEIQTSLDELNSITTHLQHIF